ncbi:MAG: hypothetical protein LBH25_09595 [Fibromonadaceae bacterium]|nr:hypothetical protein [Fibromonadaceae bacterium]
MNRPLSERGKKGTGTVSTTTIAGLSSIQVWERPELNNGDIKYSVSRLDAQSSLLGIGGTVYYVRKYT